MRRIRVVAHFYDREQKLRWFMTDFSKFFENNLERRSTAIAKTPPNVVWGRWGKGRWRSEWSQFGRPKSRLLLDLFSAGRENPRRDHTDFGLWSQFLPLVFLAKAVISPEKVLIKRLLLSARALVDKWKTETNDIPLRSERNRLSVYQALWKIVFVWCVYAAVLCIFTDGRKNLTEGYTRAAAYRRCCSHLAKASQRLVRHVWNADLCTNLFGVWAEQGFSCRSPLSPIGDNFKN